MAERIESAFRLSYRVSADVRASPAAIWAKLTDAAGFPAWNSTVTSIEGAVAPGNRLRIRVPIAPDRVFSPTVVGFDLARRMTWRDGFFPMFEGTRTFTLSLAAADVTRFEMVEVFRGLMLPLVKGSLPDFGPVFDQYVADLKRACETG